jgi:hypothetical protein
VGLGPESVAIEGISPSSAAMASQTRYAAKHLLFVPKTYPTLGVFDSKPDLSAFQTGGFPSGSRLGETPGSPVPAEPPPNPKLGLAPLSSELAFSSFLSGRGESRPL